MTPIACTVHDTILNISLRAGVLVKPSVGHRRGVRNPCTSVHCPISHSAVVYNLGGLMHVYIPFLQRESIYLRMDQVSRHLHS